MYHLATLLRTCDSFPAPLHPHPLRRPHAEVHEVLVTQQPHGPLRPRAGRRAHAPILLNPPFSLIFVTSVSGFIERAPQKKQAATLNFVNLISFFFIFFPQNVTNADIAKWVR
jgi:threonine/homoserine/homoserine lactone efflux protein